MTRASRHLRITRIYGLSFAVLFTLALTALLGQLFGAFADSAESFAPYFDTRLERIQHGLGAYLLAASGIAFVGFAARAATTLVAASAATAEAPMPGLIAAVFASLVGVASAALATVSLSVGFGQITGDPGIRAGQDLLPQLGYVVLTVPAALSAAFTLWLLARLASRTTIWPPWVTISGYVVAVLQLGSFYTLPLFLVPIWVLIATVQLRHQPSASRNGAP